MNDTNQRACGTATKDTMSVRLPEVTRVLKDISIKRVLGSYHDSQLALAFLNFNEKIIEPRLKQVEMIQIAQVFRSILMRRIPSRFDQGIGGGIFDWNIADDTLEHQHTVTYRGL